MSIQKTIRLMDIQDKVVSNNPEAQIDKLNIAYVYAAQQHRGQIRQSGEAYLSHPLNVAYILAEMKMDIDCIIAGLLHDTIEDTDTKSAKFHSSQKKKNRQNLLEKCLYL